MYVTLKNIIKYENISTEFLIERDFIFPSVISHTSSRRRRNHSAFNRWNIEQMLYNKLEKTNQSLYCSKSVIKRFKNLTSEYWWMMNEKLWYIIFDLASFIFQCYQLEYFFGLVKGKSVILLINRMSNVINK